jgi:hypothetical protein
MNNQLTQDIFASISQLAALCATEGISQETKDLANDQIRKLINQLEPSLQKLSLSNMGIVTK